MAACCRDHRHRLTRLRAVFDMMEAQSGAAVAAADVDTRDPERHGAAFGERRVS